jgi:hypothetical protein
MRVIKILDTAQKFLDPIFMFIFEFCTINAIQKDNSFKINTEKPEI